jgi:hypothetical protein
VADPLVIPLRVIVAEVLGHGVPQGLLAEQDQPVEAFGLDRADESFGERVQVRGLPRQLDDPDAR